MRERCRIFWFGHRARKRAENAQKAASETRRMGIGAGERAENAQEAALGTRNLDVQREKAIKSPKPV